MNDKQELENRIIDLCEQAGCSEKEQKYHLRQYLRKWNPHPPQKFVNWWRTQPDYGQGIHAESAFNCQCYRDQFAEAKAIGIA